MCIFFFQKSKTTFKIFVKRTVLTSGQCYMYSISLEDHNLSQLPREMENPTKHIKTHINKNKCPKAELMIYFVHLHVQHFQENVCTNAKWLQK